MQQTKEEAQTVLLILLLFLALACPSSIAQQETLTLSAKHPTSAISSPKIIRKHTFITPAIREIKKGNSREIKAYAIKSHPKNVRIVYAATEEGLFKSIDKGKTFRRIYPEDAKKKIPAYDVSVCYKDPSIVCIASEDGVFLSKRSGYWLRDITKNIADFKGRVVEIHPYKRRTIFAGSDERLYRTQDDGRTWVKVLDEKVTKVSFDRDNPRRVRLETKNGPLASNDSGISYEVLASKNEK